ncbi:MAG: hypothetical protein HY658_08000 [Actinobacteria bacterium]|nr:hypothetical protein [Actinomycetota bacterium]
MALRGTVLVVGDDADVRERMAWWLQDAGLEVLACPGPAGPHAGCVGLRWSRCPLVDPVDVVVLDVGSAGPWDPGRLAALVALYSAGGRRVVALCPEGAPAGGRRLGRPVRRGSLIEAVRDLLAGG